jgi:hypothetical protein
MLNSCFAQSKLREADEPTEYERAAAHLSPVELRCWIRKHYTKCYVPEDVLTTMSLSLQEHAFTPERLYKL